MTTKIFICLPRLLIQSKRLFQFLVLVFLALELTIKTLQLLGNLVKKAISFLVFVAVGAFAFCDFFS